MENMIINRVALPDHDFCITSNKSFDVACQQSQSTSCHGQENLRHAELL